MVHFTETNQTPPPYSMLQDVNKILSQILPNDIDNGVRGIGLRIYVRFCLKKQIKNKRRLEKTGHYFLLKLTLLNL